MRLHYSVLIIIYFSTFPLGEIHVKANKMSLSNNYKMCMQKPTWVENRNGNPNDIYVVKNLMSKVLINYFFLEIF